ncbi:hypothetical protein L332_04275 [Agrococcus pavilionensis RW1]|uniref:Prepilin-type N-terminal cleavage/methylation domain-containing protein n=1 Tax=Agrococcus pavilionensis RW1 TaxID=1330458 RepID=U1MSP4_9MICO|nr:type II secretion system protein [Agrococcus pavilionensis]ERG63670.1 hypothetical protein L332_04275 [Agrococcus pavilionensis RW1]
MTADSRDRGMTLVELLVAISLLAIATTLITAMVVTLARSSTRQEAEQYSSRTAAVALDQVGRVVRGATPTLHANGWQQLPAVVEARADRVRLSTYLETDADNPAPTLVELRIDAASGTMTETRWASYRSGGVWAFQSTPFRTRAILAGVLPPGRSLPSGGSVGRAFDYFAADGRALPLPTSGQLTDAQRAEVSSIHVALAVQAQPGTAAAPAVIETTVMMPNIPEPDEED